MLNRNERDQLKALSKEVFGVSSRYQRFLEGVAEVITHEVDEEVPGDGDAPATTRKVRVPTLTANGVKQTRIKRYTFQETLDLLLSFKAQRDAMIKAQLDQQAAAAAKKAQAELQKKVQDELAGSCA